MSKMKEDMLKFKEKLENSDIIERNYRNHNLIIFGMDEYQHENKWDTMFRVMDLFASEMHINIHEDSIDNCYWIGSRRGHRSLLVRFTRIITRDAVLEQAKILRGTKIRLERDFDFYTRRVS